MTEVPDNAEGALSPYRRPPAPPAPETLRNLDDWERLVETSLERVTETAQRWQAGLAGFIGVITTILLLEGGKAAEMQTAWRYVTLGLLLGAVLVAIIGLWKALSAAAPGHVVASYAAVIAQHRTIRAYKTSAAKAALTRLAWAKGLVAVACVLLVAAIVIWWIAPLQATCP